MPPDQRRRFDDEQGGLPIEESRPEDQRDTSRIRESVRPDLMFLIEGQLLSEEEVFRKQRCAGTE